MKIENGTLWLHQSDISHYLKCPEQFRQTNGLMPGGLWVKPEGGKVETDAATVGTVLHAVIEQDLKEPFGKLAAATKYGMLWFRDLIDQYLTDEVEYRTESFGADPQKALDQIKFLIENWFRSDERQYWLHRDQSGYIPEWEFDIPFITISNPKTIREVRLAGQADIMDMEANRVLDWKSASRPYQRWEYQRWGVQPTVYTFAGVESGLIVPDADGFAQFDYRVFVRGKDKDCQEVTVYRGNGQWGWLTMLVNNIVNMIESDAETWPLSDDHALCGPKWCPVWSTCKGAFVDEQWR